MTEAQPDFWYLASYPKSGNTWCRVFLTELLRLAGGKGDQELNLNRDVETGAIASSRLWLNDQLGVNSCDLSFAEIDSLRSQVGSSNWLFADGERFHKVHDAFHSPDSRGRSVVALQGCRGVVYILRHPEDVAVSLSHFFDWSLERCVQFLLDPVAALAASDRHGNLQVRQHLGPWDQHVRSWVDQKNIPLLVVRYEDMLNRGSETFQTLSDFLELPASQAEIEQVLENTSIARLQQMEEQLGGFSEKPKQCNRFFRSGRSGEGAERLTREQRWHLSKQLAEIMVRFGYETVEQI